MRLIWVRENISHVAYTHARHGLNRLPPTITRPNFSALSAVGSPLPPSDLPLSKFPYRPPTNCFWRWPQQDGDPPFTCRVSSRRDTPAGPPVIYRWAFSRTQVSGHEVLIGGRDRPDCRVGHARQLRSSRPASVVARRSRRAWGYSVLESSLVSSDNQSVRRRSRRVGRLVLS